MSSGINGRKRERMNMENFIKRGFFIV